MKGVIREIIWDNNHPLHCTTALLLLGVNVIVGISTGFIHNDEQLRTAQIFRQFIGANFMAGSLWFAYRSIIYRDTSRIYTMVRVAYVLVAIWFMYIGVDMIVNAQ